tara:strand:+ start:396 stop:560 length:165 start_codon:yes stop_codon:yes gene_type:complete
MNMKKDMEELIELGNTMLHYVVQMKDELHTTNKIAITVSVVNVITLGVIFWGLL